MSVVHVVVPAGIDDRARPSGGNVYDRRICNGLVDLGWDVHEHHVAGPWPAVDPEGVAALTAAVSAVPDGTVLLVDGLLASVSAGALVPAARRVRLVVLVHMPLLVPDEAAVLAAAQAVVTTSGWTRQQLLDAYALDPARVIVVEPGVDPVVELGRRRDGHDLLCVAPVSRHKGHDTLVAALAAVRELDWHCRLVGSLDRDPPFVDRVRRQLARDDLADRVELCGPRTGPELTAAYANADLLVHPSLGETYGMVVTEALAHALPVIATDVGGVPEALGETPIGRPGLLVEASRPGCLASALRTWLTDGDVRDRLRRAAAHRRRTLSSWEVTSSRMAHVLAAATS